ncbi:unnamed protein product [Auanema sp. JU1783]|nr:unnamed protein product [Auanema sp. JU1783]
MLIHSLLCLFLTFLLIDTRQIYQSTLSEWYRQPGNPGVKIRLTKKGINHLKTVGVKLLNEQIANLRGYSTSFPFSQPGLEGFVSLNNVNVLQYNPPQVSVVNFLPPRYIVFGLENMDISLAGNFFGTGGPIQVGGTVDGSLLGMTVALTAEFTKNAHGMMSVQVPNCSTIIGRSHFNINPQGPMGPLVKTLEAFINDGIRQRIPTMFCKKLKHLIEDNSPKMFAKLTRTNFGEHFKGDLIENTVMKKFIMDFVKGLYIDNRNIADPIVTYDYFETQNKGEVRYMDSNEPTPFYPKEMQTDEDSDRMLYFYGSDYIFNSLLYHAYQTNKLNIELNHHNLPAQYKSLVSTSCSSQGATSFASSVCVGKLIPALAKAYPNTTTSFVLIPHGLPEFSFNGDAGAIRLSSRIITYVDYKGHLKQVIVSSADGQADINLSAQGGKLGGDLKLNRLAVRLHRSAIEIEPSAIEQLTPLAKTFIGPQLSQALHKGVPFPLQDSITFVDPKLKVHNGFIELGTDFILNENALRMKMQETFADMDI